MFNAQHHYITLNRINIGIYIYIFVDYYVSCVDCFMSNIQFQSEWTLNIHGALGWVLKGCLDVNLSLVGVFIYLNAWSSKLSCHCHLVYFSVSFELVFFFVEFIFWKSRAFVLEFSWSNQWPETDDTQNRTVEWSSKTSSISWSRSMKRAAFMRNR